MTDAIDRDAIRDSLKAALAEHDLLLDEISWKENFRKQTLGVGVKVTTFHTPNRDALRGALRDALLEHGLALDEVSWKENLKKETLAIGLKVSGDLAVQQDLALSGAEA